MPEPTPADLLRLNLGSGQNPKPGYVNVDRFGSPDVKWDLEQFPWPWQENSAEEVQLIHVLEHLGQSVATYFQIIKELYRICRHGALIHIAVPHPRHDDFLGDPTHVRPFIPQSFYLYSKEQNREWAKRRCANSPLGLHLDVDFLVENMELRLDEAWAPRFRKGEFTSEQLEEYARRYNNVVKEIRVRWRVNKPPPE